MKPVKKSLSLFFLICVVALAGCANRHAIFTNRIVSPVGVDREYIKNNFELIEQNAEVVLNRHLLVYIPLSGYYSFDDVTVTNELLYKYQADLVTDLRIEKKILFLLYYNRYYVVAKGKVWRRKRKT